MATNQQLEDPPTCIYCGEPINSGDAFVVMSHGSITSEGDEIIDRTERYCHWPKCTEEFAAESGDESED